MVKLLIVFKPEMTAEIFFKYAEKRYQLREGVLIALEGIGIDRQSVIDPCIFDGFNINAKIMCQSESDAVRFKLEHLDNFKEIRVSA